MRNSIPWKRAIVACMLAASLTALLECSPGVSAAQDTGDEKKRKETLDYATDLALDFKKAVYNQQYEAAALLMSLELKKTIQEKHKGDSAAFAKELAPLAKVWNSVGLAAEMRVGKLSPDLSEASFELGEMGGFGKIRVGAVESEKGKWRVTFFSR